MKQLPIRGLKKFPNCKKGFLETNRIASPSGQRKSLDIQALQPWQSLLCREWEGRELQGEVGQLFKARCGVNTVFRVPAQPNASTDTAQYTTASSPSTFSFSLTHIPSTTGTVVQELGHKCNHILDTAQHLLFGNNCPGADI